MMMVGMSWAAEPGGETSEAEARALLELVNTAPPAPNPPGKTYSSSRSASAEQRRVVEYDPLTGQERVVEITDREDVSGRDKPYIPPVGPVAEPLMVDELGGGRITPTAPSPLLGTDSFPYRTVYKMVMRYNVGGTDFFYSCTGWASNEFQVVTAGHCIYNFDPNDDGSEADQKWADEVWLFPGQTDRVDPTGDEFSAADRIYGPVKATYLRSYTGWTDNHNYDHDWGVLTLDRRIGNRTGWMGRESSVANSLNFTGYPTETPYVPDDTHVQYKGYDSSNVDSNDSYRIYLDAFIYGGHSGGPSWRYDSGTGDRYVEGIHSTSDRVGDATDVRLTSGKRSDINSWASDDETDRAPFDRAELVEYALDGGDHKGISPLSAGRGDTIDVEMNVLNVGFDDAHNVSFDIYASSNDYVSENDTLLGSVTYGTLGDWSFWSDFTREVEIPTSLNAGEYWVGWIVDTTSAEYGGDLECTNNDCSNHVVIDERLTVQDCTLDSYEPDESSIPTIFSGSPQDRSICSIGEDDWAEFSLSRPSEVVIETSGPSGDTRLWLLNGSGGQIEYDDDGGSSTFSRIDRVCTGDYLSAGTYRVNVDEYFDNDFIQDYDLTMTASTCEGGPLAVYSVTVDDDSSGQSNGNGNGIAECGETVELDVALVNQGGDFTVYDPSATLSTTDQYFGGFPYNNSSSYVDVAPASWQPNSDDFDMSISPDAPHGHSMGFSVQITSDNGGPWADSFSLPIECPGSLCDVDLTNECNVADLAWVLRCAADPVGCASPGDPNINGDAVIDGGDIEAMLDLLF
jgi:V8-like Glu-specific endopeptidase